MRLVPKLGLQATAIVMATLLFSTSVMAQDQDAAWNSSAKTSAQSVPSQNNVSADASAAIIDAQRDADMDGNGGLWFIAGCLGGLVGIIIAYAIEPEPPATRLLGKSATYVATYSDEYRKDLRGERTKMAWIGCGVTTLIYLVFFAIASAASSSNNNGN